MERSVIDQSGLFLFLYLILCSTCKYNFRFTFHISCFLTSLYICICIMILVLFVLYFVVAFCILCLYFAIEEEHRALVERSVIDRNGNK